jgi:hypothetical protein
MGSDIHYEGDFRLRYPRIIHKEESELEEDEDSDALVLGEGDIERFDNLSRGSKGASPSNSAVAGWATAMAEGPGGQSIAVLQRGVELPKDDSVDESLGIVDELAHDCIGVLRFWGPMTEAPLEANDGDVESLIVNFSLQKYNYI